MPLPANAPVAIEQDDMPPAAAKPALSLVPGGLSERIAPAPRPVPSAMAARAAIRPAVRPESVATGVGATDSGLTAGRR